jgi:hypothetical protein
MVSEYATAFVYVNAPVVVESEFESGKKSKIWGAFYYEDAKGQGYWYCDTCRRRIETVSNVW